jgi:hypothetical protein
MMDFGKETQGRVMVFRYGLMELNIKVNGQITRPKEKENLFM